MVNARQILAGIAAGSAATENLSATDLANAALLPFSKQCRAAIKEVVATDSYTGECLHTSLVWAGLNQNGSLVPYLDKWVQATCEDAPCSQANLTKAADFIADKCNDQESGLSFPRKWVHEIVGLYPLAREISCLQTDEKFPHYPNDTAIATNGTSTNGTSTNGTTVTNGTVDGNSTGLNGTDANSTNGNTATIVPVPIVGGSGDSNTTVVTNGTTVDNSTSTNGTIITNGTSTTNASEEGPQYCLVGIASELEASLGHPFTLNYLLRLASGSQGSAAELVSKIPKEVLCNDCVYATLDLVYQSVPEWFTVPEQVNATFVNGTITTNGTIDANGTLSNVTVDGNATVTNGTIDANGTITNGTATNGTEVPSPFIALFQGYCGYELTSNGSIPDSISLGASDSTYTHEITNANGTVLHTPPPPPRPTAPSTATAPPASTSASSVSASSESVSSESASVTDAPTVSPSVIPTVAPTDAPSASPSAGFAGRRRNHFF
ncbi:hypothetical protein Q8F55_007465 [Vanrija albida]|uniref:Uncharacterized protein n=1 Tax=Vanrija albida TaxID=181172 RepID=A0ABR3PTL4_9TREE